MTVGSMIAERSATSFWSPSDTFHDAIELRGHVAVLASTAAQPTAVAFAVSVIVDSPASWME